MVDNEPLPEKENIIFVLGAGDPEMYLIERMLDACGIQFVYATCHEQRIKPSYAYTNAWVDTKELPEHPYVITVECRVNNSASDHHIDHHRPGDFGFDMEPKDYWMGSSLGQTYHFLTHSLGIDPETFSLFDWEFTLAAAADHCLMHAYQGRCPGVTPRELMLWRAFTRSRRRKNPIPMERLLENVAKAKKIIQEAPELELVGEKYRDVGRKRAYELPEASAQLAIPIEYILPDYPHQQGQRVNTYCRTRPQRMKNGLLGGSPELIKAWMNYKEGVLDDIYGNPQRGYAGGYFKDR